MAKIKFDEATPIVLADVYRWLAKLNALRAGLMDAAAPCMAIEIGELIDELEAVAEAVTQES